MRKQKKQYDVFAVYTVPKGTVFASAYGEKFRKGWVATVWARGLKNAIAKGERKIKSFAPRHSKLCFVKGKKQIPSAEV